MPAPLLVVPSSEKLPDSADAVVIGGGIVGASSAYFMARQGLRVALVEKGRIGAEQSSRNWGWCRQQNRDGRELPMATQSLALWEEMTEDIGEDLGFRRCGLVYASNDAAQVAQWERWRETAKQFGVETRLLTGPEALSPFRGAAVQVRNYRALTAPDWDQVLKAVAAAVAAALASSAVAAAATVTTSALSGLQR